MWKSQKIIICNENIYIFNSFSTCWTYHFFNTSSHLYEIYFEKNLDIDQQHELQCSTSTSTTDFLEEHQNTHISSFLKNNIKCTNINSCLCCERLYFHKQLTLVFNIFLMKLQPFKTFVWHSFLNVFCLFAMHVSQWLIKGKVFFYQVPT